MRTNGRNANDILALFDRLGDAFAGGAEAKPGGKTDPPAGAAQAAAQEGLAQAKDAQQQRANLGFDKEDKTSLPAQAKTNAPAAEQKPEQKPKDARDKEATRDNKEQATFLSQAQQLGTKLQENLQKGLAAAFAKLATLGKGTEGAEPDQHLVPSHSKDGAHAKDAKHGAGSEKTRAAAEKGHVEDPSNFASHTTEGAPNDGRGKMKAQDKAETNVEHFREELRQMNAEQRGDKKLDKPRDGKEAHELVHGEGMIDQAGELRELVGAWHPDRCNAEEAEQKANALRIEDALGEQMRCRGMLEDGVRCIRKPVMGLPYCREHAATIYSAGSDAGFVTIGAGVEPTSVAPEVTEPEAAAYISDVLEAPASEELADPTLPDQPAFGTVVTD